MDERKPRIKRKYPTQKSEKILVRSNDRIFTVIIVKDEIEGSWFGRVKDLSGVDECGDDKYELVEKLKKKINVWIMENDVENDADTNW